MSTPIKDMTAKKVGSLTPIKAEKRDNKLQWLCKCDCGNYCYYEGSKLRWSQKTSGFLTCGCSKIKYNGDIRTIVGIKTPLINIISFDKDKNLYLCREKSNNLVWLTATNAKARIFRSPQFETKLKAKNQIAKLYGYANIKEFNKDSIHLHHILTLIKNRCYDKEYQNYKYYGGRGIEVCQEWLQNPKNFVKWAMLNGFKHGLQIDRINNDGNYETSNCRWITKLENANNTRKNVYIKFKNQTKTLSQWCREYNLNYKKVHYLFKYKNKSLEDIIKQFQN